MFAPEAFCPQLHQEAMVPLLCWLNHHHLPEGSTEGSEGWPVWCPQRMTNANSCSDQEAKALGMSWQISQIATALLNEIRNCSTILIPAHLRSCSSKHSADLPFFLEAVVLPSPAMHIPKEDPWCPHPQHPCEFSQVLGFIPQRYWSVQTFFTCSDHFSSLGTHTSMPLPN